MSRSRPRTRRLSTGLCRRANTAARGFKTRPTRSPAAGGEEEGGRREENGGRREENGQKQRRVAQPSLNPESSLLCPHVDASRKRGRLKFRRSGSSVPDESLC